MEMIEISLETADLQLGSLLPRLNPQSFVTVCSGIMNKDVYSLTFLL